MNKKQLWWSGASAAVLLIALIIAIVSNKETSETTIDKPALTETLIQDKSTVQADEPKLTEDPKKEQHEINETEKDVSEPEKPIKEQSTKPSTGQSTTGQDASSAQSSKTIPKPAKPEKQTIPSTTTPITDGTYQVGTDIAQGEYLVFSNGITLLENTKDQSGNPESIVFNVALDGRSHTYVTLREGEYFTLKGGEMYPAASAPSIKPANGIYKDGQYKVGTDLPAGSYTLLADDQSDIGFYEISKNSRQDMMDLLVSDVVEGETSIDITNGQYLTIRNAYLEVQ
ncbi:hypothetical protein CSV71_03560 [Sporosarcina sp. P21c]|uniref:hypothetical protein n=1 Tax=Sporosarcina TaxID=1569 RepID=UPI000A1693FE|nr:MULTISPECIES: hypothetical protein [Sporosarcina]ARJ37888.1 hypothetical protein SporoP8_02660 [Sporosarcina ureae]PIC67796.1 hypothetical protein CSV78_05650 [Sporosarcina sp. P16a]PIC83789.1 hypothetical protein CSV73_05520 [Sporosarcina sp. P1]PIC90655.1 hypothetical protein CSV71_03560 [Sporosarcina sp. P21c]PIC93421.1 hypothetical protein CSV70_05515 [Sporosarcina sp. P25]